MSAQPQHAIPTALQPMKTQLTASQGSPSDAPRLRILPIPPTEPPAVRVDYGSPPGVPAKARFVQATLQINFAPPTRAPAVRATEAGIADGFFGPQATPTAALPCAQAWSARLVRLVLECMDGMRPSTQLTRWVSPELHERIARRGLLARRRRERPHAALVQRVHVCEPADGVAEVAAVVRYRGRCRAIAIRLVGIDGRWLATELEIG